jgi:alpha-tubulin suppressor-like RCC1 family protein
MREVWKSGSRGRLMFLGVCTLGLAGLLGSAACSVLLNSDKTQCSKDSDCTALGPSFAGMTCSPQAVCVSPLGDANADKPVVPGDSVAELKAGHYHACVRRVSGQVWCWGKNESGQTGNGKDPAVAPIVTIPEQVVGVAGAVEISSGEDHSCARLGDGSVLCWGSNVDGQLGSGDLNPSKTPVKVNLGGKAKSIADGAAFTCAALETGSVLCWGSNSQGQMGNGKGPADTLRAPAPVAVTGITNAVSVYAGEEHACALLANGTVVCWGANDADQLGLGEPPAEAGPPLERSLVPAKVAVLADVRLVALGEKHSCATLGNKDTYCWGENAHGQLGLPLTTAGTPTPTLVDAIAGGTTELSAGGDHVCAQLKDGSLVCWGSNAHDELGRDVSEFAQSVAPVELKGVGASRIVSAGDEHTCALLLTGKVVCFGQNKQGQCGDGLKEDISPLPVDVVGVP